MRILALCALLALAAAPAATLEPYLVKDINLGHDPAGSLPVLFAPLGGAALFAADDGSGDYELWRSDGTEEGTWQVADLCPGPCSGFPVPYAITERLLFFVAFADPGLPNGLWATDGTPEGTFLLTEPGVEIGFQSLWMPEQGILYFSPADAEHGHELWRSDGTPSGTWLVTDLEPGPAGSEPQGFTRFQGQVWFGANDDLGAGGGLWRTDGTSGGTQRVKRLDRAPRSLQVVGKRLVFVAPGPDGGDELWASDGTSRGTVPITRLAAGGSFPSFYRFAVYGSRLYFVADDGRRGQELYATDGTARGTRRLTGFARKAAFELGSTGPSFPLPPTLTGGRLVFAADDGPHGAELWVTDGTPRGTRLVRDVCPGRCSGVNALWRTHRGLLFWVGDDGEHGRELWVTDGTSAGTRLVADLFPGGEGSQPSFPFLVGDRLLFAAVDGSHSDELWTSDGTEAGTVRITDLDPFQPWQFSFSGTVVGGRLLFTAWDGEHGSELWVTDGTGGGTAFVRDINERVLGGSRPALLGALGSTAFFFADDGIEGFELWKSDGTEAGTSRVLELFPGSRQPFAEPIATPAVQLGGTLFFSMDPVYSGERRLWRTDGTAAGTFALTAVGIAAELRPLGGLLFFSFEDEAHGAELWATDGTVEGTRVVADILPGPDGSAPQNLVVLQGNLYFTAINPEGVRELWRSDGTAAGTVRVAGLGTVESLPTLLTVHAGRLWFFADDGEHGRELWRSDGTEEGTAMAVDIEPGPGGLDANLLVSFGTKLAVSAGSGLWVTEGTVAERVGPAWDGVSEVAAFEGRLYYTAGLPDAPHRIALVTDGTPEGTVPLRDPDGSSLPSYFAFAPLDGRLLFTTGVDRKLWAADGTEAVAIREEGFESQGGRLLAAGPRVFLAAYGEHIGIELWAVQEEAP